MAFKDEVRTMAVSEFENLVKKGKKIAILDKYVVDFTQYEQFHPGGANFLKLNAGRDISKFFYGGYVMQSQLGMKPHTHSNIARKIVNDLIIAKLDFEVPTTNATILATYDVNKATKTFVFKPDKEVQSKSFNNYGKHYLVS